MLTVETWVAILAAECLIQDTFMWVKRGKLQYQPEPYVREWVARRNGWSKSTKPIPWWSGC